MSESSTRFGKYELLEKIGTGGMAEIYKARVAGPDGFEKILVVKKILPAYAQNRAFILMLIAEAKVSSVLQHANVVQIFELGEIDGQYYIAMEYVDGADLLAILTECTRQRRRIPAEIAMFIVSEICKGLAYAHSATDTKGRPLRIIHRDVSPSNVLISVQGDVKVMDFGVARADLERASGERPRGADDGVMKGKLGYMSPEQVVGAEIDHRSDIFALGIILFETLTLKRLFLGKDDLETLINIRDVKVDAKLKKHSYIPEGIQAMLRRALARDPRDRYETATDFQEAILDYLFENRLRVSNRRVARFTSLVLRGEVPPPVEAHTPAPDFGDEEAASGGESPEQAAPARPAAMEVEATVHQSGLSHSTTPPPPLPDDADGADDDRAAAAGLDSEPDVPPPPPRSEPASQVEHAHLTRALFRLAHRDGSIFGPVSFENLVSLLKNRSVSPRELLSIDERDWVPVADLPAVRQLEPELFQEEPEAAIHEGPLSHMMTPRLLYRLSVSRVAGKLKLTQGSLLKEIYFQNGVPVHITSNLKHELLGGFMLERGTVTEDELAAALDSIREHGGRLGDGLVRLGTLKPHDLFRVLELQFRQKFLEIFRWRRGWYQFFEGHNPPDDMVWMGHDTVQLITVGVRTQYDLPTLRETFGDHIDQEIHLQHNPHITHNNLRFNSKELRFYTYLEDHLSLREALDRYGRSEEECLTLMQVVFVLLQTDLLALRMPQSPRR
ncbi:MAG: serine/threonine protein kinase [Deltaproteobacteria bacterium]|nr:serine/threonine protein kinase [Deltaproteobacteria bacterium]MCB9785501.1 serine/threonine protein kinase [Deltaproteobacteria bacterium]